MVETKEVGFIEGYEAKLDEVFNKLCSNGVCDIPGFVVMAKRGSSKYHKAFGSSDKEKGDKMELDAQFRCYSMTKVITCTVLYMLKEKGVVDFEASVGEYIPSFKKEW